MIKNKYAPLDFIRQGKFKTPDKMLIVEDLIKTKQIVINWWCRQSGKSLTAIKLSRDYAINNNNCVISIVTTTGANAKILTENIERSIDRKLIREKTNQMIVLNNDSIIVVYSAHNLKNTIPKSAFVTSSMIIVDEFEYIDSSIMDEIITFTKTNIVKSLLNRVKVKLGILTPKKFIFFSSKKSEQTYDKLKLEFPQNCAGYTYLNWEKLKFDKSKLVSILGEDTFNREYNSYNEN